MEKQHTWPHSTSQYLNFPSCKTDFKTAMMIIPYEEITSVVTDYPRAKGLRESRQEVRDPKRKVEGHKEKNSFTSVRVTVLTSLNFN